MPRARASSPSRIRIKDVARRARVSTGTVSHVLTGRTQVSAELSARVQKAIDDLGYVPNIHAQGLRRARSHAVGICLPQGSTAYLNGLSEALERIASAAGYSVVHVFSRHEPAIELARVKDLIRYGVDGLILFPSPTPARAMDLVTRKGIPLVIVDRPTPEARVDQVVLDNRAAMQEIVRRLIAFGHRRLLFVCASRARLVTVHRLQGLEAARRGALAQIDFECLEIGDDSVPLRGGLVRALKRRHPATAVIVSNSHQASLLLAYLAELAVRCPDDVSVVAFDDPEWSTLVTPRLSVVRQPAPAIAQAAWDMLMERIARPGRACRTVTLPTSIELRDSVGPARAGTRHARA